jgi:endonuclease/exonuclease/phosphatase family metal-dependent hydrolase
MLVDKASRLLIKYSATPAFQQYWSRQRQEATMVQYSAMRNWKDTAARDRAIDRLLALRGGLAKTVTPANKLSSFHLATWNLRDFGGHRLNPNPPGKRYDESLLYIAEIISAFDLVAVQEVNEDMSQFKMLMDYLGRHWTHLVTDASGNTERLAFVYDTRKIWFRNIAGEIVLPPVKGKPVAQFNRTPYLVAFQAGWFKFNICTVHIYYGSAADTKQRIEEIDNIAKFFAKRQKEDGETYILLGDFNILNPDDPTMGALLGGGFEVPKELRNPTAVASVNYYDQIALRQAKKKVEIVKAGVFQWQDYVFRDTEDYATYKSFMSAKTNTGKAAQTDIAAYRKWRTWQMSDHKPLWAEIKVDFTNDYLTSLKAGAEPLANF